MCMCVCPPLRLLITSDVMWRDMDPIQLVKEILQLLYGNYSRSQVAVKSTKTAKFIVLEKFPLYGTNNPKSYI